MQVNREQVQGFRTSLCDLPPEVLMRIVILGGHAVLLVNRMLRELCHAHATAVTLTRGYSGAADDAQVAIMARCPQLVRVDATQYWPRNASWPLASLTRVTSLTAWPHWRAELLPPSLRELVIPRLWQEEAYARSKAHDDAPNLDDGLDLLAELRDWDCIVRVLDAQAVTDRLNALRKVAHKLRLDKLSLWQPLPCMCPLGKSFPALTSLELYDADMASLHPLLELPLLQHMHLYSCPRLRRINTPLLKLTSLSITSCPALVDLDAAMARMPNLQRLDVEDSPPALNTARAAALAPALVSLRLECHEPAHLQPLRACAALTHLVVDFFGFAPRPEQLQPLRSLRVLGLSDISLATIQNCDATVAAQLTLLSVNNRRMASFAGWSHLCALETLEVFGCLWLQSLWGLPTSGMPQLTSIAIEESNNLPSLADLPNTPRLEKLQLLNCASITSIHCPGLVAVTSLTLSGCRKLRSLQELSNASALCSLEISEVSLTSLHGLEAASQLSALRIDQVGGVSSLRGLGDKPRLARLDLSSLSRLADLQGLNAASLLRLVISDCTALSSLEGIASAVGLTMLTMERCGVTSLETLAPCVRLQELCQLDPTQKLHALQHLLCFELAALRTLHLSVHAQGSPLANLLELASATQLCSIFLSGVTALTSLHGLEGAAGLEALAIHSAPSLRSLRGVSPAARLTSLVLHSVGVAHNDAQLSTGRLKTLKLVSCGQVARIAAFGAPDLAALTKLCLIGLPLRDLAGVERATRLREVKLCSCASLTCLEALMEGRRDEGDCHAGGGALSITVRDCGVSLQQYVGDEYDSDSASELSDAALSEEDEERRRAAMPRGSDGGALA